MTRGKDLVLGAFTVWPYVYILFFLFSTIASAAYASTLLIGPDAFMRLNEFVRGYKTIVVGLCILTMLEVLALVVFYLVFLFRTDRVAQGKRALWAVGLLVGSFVAMLLFWTIHIWSRLEAPSQEDSG